MTKDNRRIIDGILYSYLQLTNDIKDIRAEIEYIKHNYNGAAAIKLNDNVSSKTNKITSKVEREVLDREKLLYDLNKMLAWKELKIFKLENIIEAFNDEIKSILKLRYFQGKTIKEISQKVGISEDRVTRRINNALEQVQHLILNIG